MTNGSSAGDHFGMPAQVAEVVRPRERLSVAEWAKQKPFIINTKMAVRPGPLDLEWTPYWREPMDAVGDPAVQKLSIVASPQSGKTTLLEVVVCWLALHRPANMMYVRPTEPDIVEAFRDRFEPILRANVPELLPARGEFVITGDNPVIKLTSMHIYGAAVTVDRHMTSRTTPLIGFDECDTGVDSTSGFGDIMLSLEDRQAAASALRSKQISISSPKYEYGPNWVGYDQKSDRRRYWEPCPYCGVYQVLNLSQIRCVEPDLRDAQQIVLEKMARYVCIGCGSMIEPEWQGWMSDRGIWVPGCQLVDVADVLPDNDRIREAAKTVVPGGDRWEPPRKGPESLNPHRGYQVWRAMSKMEKASWSHILAANFEAAKSKDPSKLQVFVNSWLAEPWKTTTPAADEDTIRARKGVYEPRVVPARAKVVLAGVDVQDDCLYYVARAFGANQESWLIEQGAVEVSKVRQLLDVTQWSSGPYMAALEWLYQRMVMRGWPIKGEPHLHMRAAALAVDSGYKPDEPYEFSRRPCVIVTKGHDDADYRVRPTQVEGKIRPDPIYLWHVNTRVFKDRLQRLIRSAEGEPGEWHLHCETPEEYVEHLAAEHLAPHKTNPKRKVWQPKTQGRPNHYLDCEVGVLALAEALEQRREVSVMTLLETDPRFGEFVPGEIAPRNPGGPGSDGGGSGGWLPPVDGNWLGR